MAEDPVEAARAAGRSRLSEAEAKALLADAGVDVPEGRVVESAAAAVEAAEAIGYPVVAKVAAPAVVHKSTWAGGAGVALGLASADAVESAAARILDAATDDGGGDREAATDGDAEASVLVEEVVDADDGTEVIVGGLRDPSFGPVVLAGLGGVYAEVFEDTSHRLAPIDRAAARAAVGELRVSRLLEGYRGRPPADLDALADVLRAVGDLVVDRPAIAEVDVNPVLASPGGAVALDATVALDGDAEVCEARAE